MAPGLHVWFAPLSGSTVLLGTLSLRSVGLLLAAGVTVLTFTLMILSRTRWGEAKPVSKCIALSVFAHLLLFVYAYDTELPQPPAAAAGSGGTVRVLTEAEAAELFPELAPPASQPIAFEPPPPPGAFPRDPDSAPVSESRPEPPSLPPTAAPQEFAPPTAAPPAIESPPEREPQPAPAVDESPREATAGPLLPRAAPLAPPALMQLPLGPPAAAEDRERPAEATEEPAPGESDPLREMPPAPPPDPSGVEPPQGTEPDEASVAAEAPSPPATDSASAPATVPSVPAEPAAEANSAAPPPAPVAVRSDGSPVPPIYQNRLAPDRLTIAAQFGGSERAEEAVQAALRWFVANQSRDGRWDPDQFGAGRETRTLGHDRQQAGAQADTGLTGLALLTFLGAGHTSLGGEHRACVQQGLEFLLHQQTADGNLAGPAELFARMYCHGMATLALGEAYALTHDERLQAPLQRALEYTVRAQHPQTGGWRYLPGDPGDISQFGWQVMALKSGEQAGLAIPTRTSAGMRKFLQSASSGAHRGLVSYRPGERPSRAMTAEGLACRWFLEMTQDGEALEEGANHFAHDLPRTERENFYYWYYGTLALFPFQDERWRTWNENLQAALLASQRRDPGFEGSWDPDPIWGGYGGRLYSTALATLCLEVYYRYQPK